MIHHNTLRSRARTLVAPAMLVLLGILLLPIRAVAENAEDILIIANKAVAAKAITLNELKSIFLGRKAGLGREGKVAPIHAKEGSKLRVDFQQRVLGMQPEEEKMYWEDQKIRTGAVKPTEFTRPLKAVFSLKRGVGYVFRKDFQEGVVQVLLVLPR